MNVYLSHPSLPLPLVGELSSEDIDKGLNQREIAVDPNQVPDQNKYGLVANETTQQWQAHFVVTSEFNLNGLQERHAQELLWIGHA